MGVGQALLFCSAYLLRCGNSINYGNNVHTACDNQVNPAHDASSANTLLGGVLYQKVLRPLP